MTIYIIDEHAHPFTIVSLLVTNDQTVFGEQTPDIYKLLSDLGPNAVVGFKDARIT